MADDTLTLDPSKMGDPPFDPSEHPEWAELSAFLRDAAQAGEVVSVSAKVETMTPAEMAERLSMSRATVSRRIAAGEIATIKVGNRHRIPVREYERFRSSLMQSIVAHYSDDLEADLYGE